MYVLKQYKKFKENAMKNFTSSRSYRPQVLQRCLLMLVMMLTFGVATFAQTYPYKVSKIDIGCGASGGSVTLSVTGKNGVKPNGSAQLRKPGDPDHTITVNGVQQLDDANLTQSSTDPNTWTKTWYNLSEGTYDVYFLITTGKKQENAGRVEVKKINETYVSPTMTYTQSDPYCSINGSNNGSVEVTVKNGLGPFHYTAEITSANGTVTTQTSGTDAIAARTWKVTKLSQGDKVKVTVADTQDGVCPSTQTSVSVEGITMGQAAAPKLSWKRYSRMYLGNCNYQDYVAVSVYGSTKEARAEQAEMLKNGGLRVDSWSGTKDVFNLEYDEAKSSSSNYSTILVFKASYKGSRQQDEWLIKQYKPLCTGVMTEDKFLYAKDMNLGSDGGNDRFFSAPFKLTSISNYNTDEDCNVLSEEYKITYSTTVSGTHYYFPEGTKAKLQKKNTETGNWDELQVEVPIGGGTLFENDERTIDVTNYGPGTYRFVYDDGCDVVNVTKEVVVEGPKNLDIKSGSTLKAWCDYGIHGNTAGTWIEVSEKPMQYGVHIERKDGATSTTFKTTPFLSNVEYEHTLSFPIDFKTTPRNGILQIYDLPVGEYEIRISRCGEISSPMSLTIGESNVIKYQPRNDSGYKNGVKVQAGCGDNTVSFNFGLGDCNHLSQDYYESNSPGSSHNSPGDFKEDTPIEVSPYLPNWQFAVGINAQTDDHVYSPIEQAYVPKSYGAVIGVNNFANKTFAFQFNPSKGDGAFEVQGAMCDLKDPNSGLITVGIKKGYEATYPLHYEIKKATEQNGVVTPGEDAREPVDITNNSGENASLHVFSGLAAGWYQVTAQYSYGNGCPAQVSNVYISPVGIPKVEAEWAEKCYGQGLAPNHLELPVSTYMYDVTWTRKDLNTQETVEMGTGNAIDAAFPKAGKYEFTVSTNFAQSIPTCGGSSGGERKVIITVGDCTGTMEKNLWVGNEDNKFENQNNWTVKVPGDGEDVVFATEANNANPKNTAQKGAAKNDCVLPEGKVLTIGTLENQSDKALVVSKKSSVVVSTALVGYNQPGDAKKLVIKTNENETDAGGSFAVSFADPCKSDVYATVELYGRGKKLGNEMLKIEDKLDGSPTKGRTLQADPYTWQQIGIPVAEIAPSPVFKGSYLQYYSEAKNSPKQYYQKWSWMAKDNTMSPFVGYQLTQEAPKVYALTGKLNLCDHNLTLTRQAAEVTKSTSNNVGEKHWGLGQNIFANSYTAAIDIDKLSFPNEVDPTVYVYHTGSFNNWYENKTTNGTQDLNVAAGGYLAVPKNSAATIGYKSIPSMQGFLLKFTDAETKVSDVPATVTIPYQSVVKNERAAMAKPFEVTTKEPGAVQMILESGKGSDVLWLIEAEGTTDRYDRGWDGRKLLTNAPASLYVQTVDGQMQVNATADLTQQQVSVEGSDSELYTLTIRKKNLPQYEHLKLVDNSARQLVDLSDDVTSYTYTMRHTGVDSNRFMLVNTTATSFDNLPTDIQGVTTATWNVPAVVYTVSDERVANVRQPEDLMRLKSQLPSGVYIVSMQINGKTVNQKMVIHQ